MLVGRDEPACDAEERFNSFNYWHVPPASPSEVGVPASPIEIGVPDDEPMHEEPVHDSNMSPVHFDEPAPATLALAQEYDENEQNGTEDDTEEPDEEEPLSLISSDAGNRLLGILGRLSQHLGANSRFARAANVLQDDVLRARLDATEHGRVGPAEGSILEQPDVRSSVVSLLTLLNDPHQPAAAGGALSSPARRLQTIELRSMPEPFVLFDMQMAMSPPLSPASPKALASLSPPACPAFGLDQPPASCPICLEPITDLSEALEMPCTRELSRDASAPAVSHAFHRPCLQQWLGARSTCPVCRFALPTEEDELARQDDATLEAAATATIAEIAENAEMVLGSVVERVAVPAALPIADAASDEATPGAQP
jgi:hypothetical protein